MTPIPCRAVPVEIRAGLLIEFSDQCWKWLGKQDRKGYGTIRETIQPHIAKDRLAHRLIYRFVKGVLADHLQLDHLCRNRLCVNPSHLEEVTNQVNAQRGATSKLSPTDVEDIRSLASRGQSKSALARKHGVHRKAIQKVLNGESWTNIPPDPTPGDKLAGSPARVTRRLRDAGEKFYDEHDP